MATNILKSQYYKLVGVLDWGDMINDIYYVVGTTTMKDAGEFDAEIYDTWFSSVSGGEELYTKLLGNNDTVFIVNTVPDNIPLTEDSEYETLYIPSGILNYLSCEEISFAQTITYKITTKPFTKVDDNHPDKKGMIEKFEEVIKRQIGTGSTYSTIYEDILLATSEYENLAEKREEVIEYLTQKDASGINDRNQMVYDARKVRYDYMNKIKKLEQRYAVVLEEQARLDELGSTLQNNIATQDEVTWLLKAIHEQLYAIDATITPTWDEIYTTAQSNLGLIEET